MKSLSSAIASQIWLPSGGLDFKITVTEPRKEEGTVTRTSIREYVTVQRGRYHSGSRSEKHRILDEVVAVTGYHRKAAIRLLRGRLRSRSGHGRPGRRPV